MEMTNNMVLIIAVIAFLCTLAGIWTLGEFGQALSKKDQITIEFLLLLLPFAWLFIAMGFDIVCEGDKK